MGRSFQLHQDFLFAIDNRREQLRVILLSNTNAVDIAALERNFGLLSWADDHILSYEVHLKKPDPAIYEYALDAFDLNPATTFFVDDLPENIAAAMKSGIQAEVFESSIQAVNALDRFLNHSNN